jgi:hypothetical protein
MPATKSPQTLGAVRVWEPYRHSAGLKGLPDYSTIGTGHGWLGSTKSAFIANGYLGAAGDERELCERAGLGGAEHHGEHRHPVQIGTRIFNSALPHLAC